MRSRQKIGKKIRKRRAQPNLEQISSNPKGGKIRRSEWGSIWPWDSQENCRDWCPAHPTGSGWARTQWAPPRAALQRRRWRPVPATAAKGWRTRRLMLNPEAWGHSFESSCLAELSSTVRTVGLSTAIIVGVRVLYFWRRSDQSKRGERGRGEREKERESHKGFCFCCCCCCCLPLPLFFVFWLNTS